MYSRRHGLFFSKDCVHWPEPHSEYLPGRAERKYLAIQITLRREVLKDSFSKNEVTL